MMGGELDNYMSGDKRRHEQTLRTSRIWRRSKGVVCLMNHVGTKDHQIGKKSHSCLTLYSVLNTQRGLLSQKKIFLLIVVNRLCFFTASPATHRSSWARGQIGPLATGLHHRHSNTRSELHLWPMPQNTGSLTHGAGQGLDLHPHGR